MGFIAEEELRRAQAQEAERLRLQQEAQRRADEEAEQQRLLDEHRRKVTLTSSLTVKLPLTPRIRFLHR
jgi:fused signal recognition particle receptor